MTFTQNLERDAKLVAAGAIGGFSAVCSLAMTMPEFSAGPDAVLAHAEWLKSDAAYVDRVVKRVAELL